MNSLNNNDNYQKPQASIPQHAPTTSHLPNIPINNSANLQNIPTGIQNSINGLPNAVIQSTTQNQLGVPFNPNQPNRMSQEPVMNNKPQQRIQPNLVEDNNRKPNIIKNLSPRKRAERGSIVGANRF